VMGIDMTFIGARGVEQHGGASIDTFAVTIDTSKMPDLQRQMMESMYPGGMKMALAGYGKRLGFAFGKDSVERVGRLVDGAAKGSLSPYVQSVIDAAAKRKESSVFVMNMAAFLNPAAGGAAGQSGLAMTFGVADKSPRMRMSLPAKHIGEI